MKTSPQIGNDVVDLDKTSSNNKQYDRRFVSRVFTNAEQNAIKKATDPDLVLWSIWAAKETAYKIRKKIDPSFILSHKRIEVDASPIRFGSEDGPRNAIDSVVTMDGSKYAIRWLWVEHHVNCIGISKNKEKTLDDV